MFKNTRQVEFAELTERMREKGIKPAGVARLLKISKASVSKILDGVQSPRDSTLELFRHIVAEHSRPSGPGVPAPRGESVVVADEYVAKLRELPAEHQRTVETLIDNLHGVSSKAIAAAKASAPAAAAAARALGRESRPSPLTGGSSVHKRGRGSGTASRLTQPPAPPGRAPK